MLPLYDTNKSIHVFHFGPSIYGTQVYLRKPNNSKIRLSRTYIDLIIFQRSLISSPITMFSLASRVARPVAAQAARRHQLQLSAGFAQTVKEGLTATDAWNKSCYSEIEYTVNENDPVYEAVQKFAAYNIGCLVTVNDEGQ